MGRLTINTCRGYELTGYEDNICETICKNKLSCNNCPINAAIIKLAQYENAEEQGLFLDLLLHIGNKIYHIEDGYIYEFNAENIDIRKEDSEYIYCIDSMDYRKDDFGKIAFFNVVEAEQALAKMKEGL